jgi:hypothetical protein
MHPELMAWRDPASGRYFVVPDTSKPDLEREMIELEPDGQVYRDVHPPVFLLLLTGPGLANDPI